MLCINKQKVLDIANFMLENKAYLADVAKEFNMSVRTAGKYVNSYLKEVDIDKYNEIRRAVKEDYFSKRKMIKNATDIFNYIIENKSSVTEQDLEKRNCCYITMKKYLRTECIRSAYSRIDEIDDIVKDIYNVSSKSNTSRNVINDRIIMIADFVIENKATIKDAAVKFSYSERSIRGYLKHNLKNIDIVRFEKVSEIIDKNKKDACVNRVKKLSKEYYDYIIENNCTIANLAKNLDKNYACIAHYIKEGKEYYPEEYKKVIEINNCSRHKTDLIYQLLVVEKKSVKETEEILGFDIKEIRRRTYDSLRSRDKEKYSAVLKALKSNRKCNYIGIGNSRLEAANKLADCIIENNITIKEAASRLGITYCTAKSYISKVIKFKDDDKYRKVRNVITSIKPNHKPRKRVKSYCRVKSTEPSTEKIKSKSIEKVKAVNNNITGKCKNTSKVKHLNDSVSKVIKPKEVTKKKVNLNSTKSKNIKVKSLKNKKAKTNNNVITLRKLNISLDEQRDIANKLAKIMEERNVNVYEASDILCVDVDLAKKCLFNNSDALDSLIYSIL